MIDAMAKGKMAKGDEFEELTTSTAKRGIIYLGGEVITTVLVLILLIFLARALQPAQFGIYSIIVAFSTILQFAGNFGVGTAFRKMLAEKGGKSEASGVLSNGYFISIVLAAIIAVIGVVVSPYIALYIYGNGSLTLLLELASIAEFLAVTYNIGLAALVGFGRVKEATLGNIAYSLFYLVIAVLLVLLGYGVTGAIIGMVVGLLAGTIVTALLILIIEKPAMLKPKRQGIKRITAFSAPVVASHLATQFGQNLSVLLLGVFAVSAIVGNYGAAFKLARFVSLGLDSISFVLLAAFAKALSNKNTAQKVGSMYNNSIYYTAVLLFPVVAYAISVSQPLTTLLFSSQYSSAPFYFAIISFGMALGLIGTYAGTLIIGHGDTRRFMKYQLGAILLQIVLLAVLTPLYGVYGVLVALFVITPIILNLIYVKALESQFKVRHAFDMFARVALAALLTGIVLYAITIALHQSKFLIAINAVVALLLFPPILAAAGGINRSKLAFIEATAAKTRYVGPVIRRLASYTSVFIRDSGKTL